MDYKQKTIKMIIKLRNLLINHADKNLTFYIYFIITLLTLLLVFVPAVGVDEDYEGECIIDRCVVNENNFKVIINESYLDLPKEYKHYDYNGYNPYTDYYNDKYYERREYQKILINNLLEKITPSREFCYFIILIIFLISLYIIDIEIKNFIKYRRDLKYYLGIKRLKNINKIVF